MTPDKVEKLWQQAMQEAKHAGERFTRFHFATLVAALVAAAESRKVAEWMLQRSYATGHGDTIEDLLQEIEWQVAERAIRAKGEV